MLKKAEREEWVKCHMNNCNYNIVENTTTSWTGDKNKACGSLQWKDHWHSFIIFEFYCGALNFVLNKAETWVCDGKLTSLINEKKKKDV